MNKVNKKPVKNNNTEFILWSVILVLMLGLFVVSITYAYFTKLIEKNGDDTQTTVTTGLLDVDFLTTKYINNVNAALIDDNQAYDLADKTVFSVSRSEYNTADNVYYVISLADLSISDNLKQSPDFKWALYDKVGLTSTMEPIAQGDFQSADGTTMSLYSNKIELPEDVTHNYTLIVWLSYDENNDQASLLNGTFEAKVEITVTNN